MKCMFGFINLVSRSNYMMFVADMFVLVEHLCK